MSDTAKLIAEVAGLRADLAKANAGPPTVMDRAAFHALDAGSRMRFIQNSGRVVNVADSTAPAAIDLERHRRQLHEQREAAIRANLARGVHTAPATTANSATRALELAARGDMAGAKAAVRDRAAAFEVLRNAPSVGRSIVGAEFVADWDRSAAFAN